MSLLMPPAALHTAEYTTEPTGPDRSLVAMRCRNASASGPATIARVSEVRSNMAVRSRVARCSVAALADQNMPGPPVTRRRGIGAVRR